jgi:hypothetical protein
MAEQPRDRREAVVWGCTTHRTPAGQSCDGCRRQGELFSRADAAQQTRKRR